MEATTVRLIKDGTRRILVFENVDDVADLAIADVVRNFLYPVKTEKMPYADKPADVTNEVAKEVSDMVEKASVVEKKSSSKSKSSDENIFIEASEGVKTEIANTKVSFKITNKTNDEKKPKFRLSLSLSIYEVMKCFEDIKCGKNPFANDMDYEEACISVYALISRILTTEKDIDSSDFIKLYEIFGYAGTLAECKENARKNAIKKKIMPLKVLSTISKKENISEEKEQENKYE